VTTAFAAVERQVAVQGGTSQDPSAAFAPILDLRTRRRFWNDVLDWLIDECLSREAAAAAAGRAATD